MEDSLKTDMKDYYNNRKVIQTLYNNDTYYGDLMGSLLSIRDQVMYIESMRIDMYSYSIRIELSKNTSLDEVTTIFNKVGNSINNYIVSNIDKITDQETANRIKYDISINKQYFDINYVGNMIEVIL